MLGWVTAEIYSSFGTETKLFVYRFKFIQTFI